MSKSNFRDNDAWRVAMDFAVAVYKASAAFPAAERFGLTYQLRRAAPSIPSNIAEGRGRGGPRDYRKFLLTARGSAFESQTQLLLARRLDFLDAAVADDLVGVSERVVQLISGLIRYCDSRTES